MNDLLEKLVANLGAKKAGAGSWLAKCPAHNDSRPSLSLRAGRTRAVVVKCFAGCSQAEVISALAKLGLWEAKR